MSRLFLYPSPLSPSPSPLSSLPLSEEHLSDCCRSHSSHPTPHKHALQYPNPHTHALLHPTPPTPPYTRTSVFNGLGELIFGALLRRCQPLHVLVLSLELRARGRVMIGPIIGRGGAGALPLHPNPPPHPPGPALSLTRPRPLPREHTLSRTHRRIEITFPRQKSALEKLPVCYGCSMYMV